MTRRSLIPFLVGASLLCALLFAWSRWSASRGTGSGTGLRPVLEADGGAIVDPESTPPDPAARARLPEGLDGDRARPDSADLPAVSGRVLARAGPGLADVEVRLFASIAGEERLLASGRSAEDGAYRFEAGPRVGLHAGEVPGMLLHVAARAPGFLPARTRARAWDGGGMEQVLEDLALDRGPTVSGRCVDGAGLPLAGAQVLLLEPGAPGGPPSARPPGAAEGPRTYAEGRADGDGRFTLPLPSESPGEVLARHPRAGSVRRDVPTRAEDAGDLDLGDLALAGEGVLAGWVRHPDGTPAAGYEVAALLADWSAARLSLAEAEARARAQEGRAGQGRLFARTRTGVDGAFEFAGLQPGTYALFHPGARVGRTEPWPLAPTGRTDLELRAPHPRLVVELRVGGRAAPGATLRLEDLAPRAGGTVPFPSPQQTRSDHEGRASFDLAPGARVGILATLPGHAPGEARIDFADGERERVVRLELDPAAAPARLTARLVDPRDGSPLPTLAELRSRRTDLVHVRLGRIEEREIPPGSYRLELRPRPGAAGLERFDLPEVRSHDLELGPGESATVELPARLGGRLRLFLELPPPPAGPRLEPPADLAGRELERWRRGLLVEVGFQAHVLGPEGRQTLLVSAEPGPSGTRFLPDPRGVLSETVLAPGTHVLELSSPPFHEVRTSVHVEPAVITDVHVPLVPR